MTVKRKKAHWAVVHHCQAQENGDYVNVLIRIFSRGNQLRYFTIAGNINCPYEKTWQSRNFFSPISLSTQVTSGTSYANGISLTRGFYAVS